MQAEDAIHVSIVSHGQLALIENLLNDIAGHCHDTPVHVTLTLNIPEQFVFDPELYDFDIVVIRNETPQGFSVNHNKAFRHGQENYPCKYFAVVNPDIRLTSDPFRSLLNCLAQDDDIGLVAPSVVNSSGVIEDSTRRFPTPFNVFNRVLGLHDRTVYADIHSVNEPDWVAGMFMVFDASVFDRVSGFDERYFLYYEDVDICARLWLSGCRVKFDRNVRVIHEARRDSHRKPKYFLWHITSALRFFMSPTYRRLKSMFYGRSGIRSGAR